jgi:acyl-CoA-binding protein
MVFLLHNAPMKIFVQQGPGSSRFFKLSDLLRLQPAGDNNGSRPGFIGVFAGKGRKKND